MYAHARIARCYGDPMPSLPRAFTQNGDATKGSHGRLTRAPGDRLRSRRGQSAPICTLRIVEREPRLRSSGLRHHACPPSAPFGAWVSTLSEATRQSIFFSPRRTRSPRRRPDAIHARCERRDTAFATAKYANHAKGGPIVDHQQSLRRDTSHALSPDFIRTSVLDPPLSKR
jgi:hypothetical protein